MVRSQVGTFLRTSHGRSRINVPGAVNAAGKEVTALINITYITAETVMEFLILLKAKYGFKPVFSVFDNAKYQHCRVVMKKAEEPGITLLFLPPCSPNPNIIERLWQFTEKQILYAKYFDSPEKFHLTVKDFFDTVNDNWHNHLIKLLSLNFQLLEQEDISQNYAA